MRILDRLGLPTLSDDPFARAAPMSRLKPPTVAEVETEYRYIMRRLFGPQPGEDLFDTDQMYRDVRTPIPRARSRPLLA